MEQISEQILNEIKQRRLSPRPRWQFLLLNSLWWLAAGLTVVAGGLSLALVINSFNTNDWAWAEYNGGWLSLAIGALPLAWLAAGLGLSLFGEYNLHHTKNAYRWKPIWILLTVLILTSGLAFGLERSGLAEELDEVLSPNLPSFLLAPTDQEGFWNKPERGLISGKVVEEKPDSVILEDASGKTWQVEFEQEPDAPTPEQRLGKKIKVFGSGDAKKFKAKQIKTCSLNKVGCHLETKTNNKKAAAGQVQGVKLNDKQPEKKEADKHDERKVDEERINKQKGPKDNSETNSADRE